MATENRSDIDQLARLLDAQFAIPGTNLRFGLDSLIGLIPGVGDVITGGLGVYIIHRARQEGAPGLLVLRMIWNLLVDTIIGSIPLVGDIFDFAFRSNMKNARLLQKHLDKQGARQA